MPSKLSNMWVSIINKKEYPERLFDDIKKFEELNDFNYLNTEDSIAQPFMGPTGNLTTKAKIRKYSAYKTQIRESKTRAKLRSHLTRTVDLTNVDELVSHQQPTNTSVFKSLEGRGSGLESI